MIDMSQSDTRIYNGVLLARVLAFVIDYILVAVLMVPSALLLFVFSILTLGLGFVIYPVLFFIVAGFYFGLTLGGKRQATPGMRAMGLAISRDDGLPVDFMTALIHLVLFWIVNSLLTPFVLLIGLFTDRGRLLHDILLGTVVYKTSA